MQPAEGFKGSCWICGGSHKKADCTQRKERERKHVGALAVEEVSEDDLTADPFGGVNWPELPQVNMLRASSPNSSGAPASVWQQPPSAIDEAPAEKRCIEVEFFLLGENACMQASSRWEIYLPEVSPSTMFAAVRHMWRLPCFALSFVDDSCYEEELADDEQMGKFVTQDRHTVLVRRQQVCPHDVGNCPSLVSASVAGTVRYVSMPEEYAGSDTIGVVFVPSEPPVLVRSSSSTKRRKVNECADEDAKLVETVSQQCSDAVLTLKFLTHAVHQLGVAVQGMVRSCDAGGRLGSPGDCSKIQGEKQMRNLRVHGGL